MTLRNYPDLTRGEGRWLNLWAAFEVTAEYLGTFTLDQLHEKASIEGKWISAVQYRRAGQRIDETALATRFNGLCKGDSPFDFTGFRILRFATSPKIPNAPVSRFASRANRRSGPSMVFMPRRMNGFWSTIATRERKAKFLPAWSS